MEVNGQLYYSTALTSRNELPALVKQKCGWARHSARTFWRRDKMIVAARNRKIHDYWLIQPVRIPVTLDVKLNCT